jgi:hypothetical protein
MYNPVFFEMMSGSIAAERVAAAERQRTASTFAAEYCTVWTTSDRRILPMPARGLQKLTHHSSAPAQPRLSRPPTVGSEGSSAELG